MKTDQNMFIMEEKLITFSDNFKIFFQAIECQSRVLIEHSVILSNKVKTLRLIINEANTYWALVELCIRCTLDNL